MFSFFKKRTGLTEGDTVGGLKVKDSLENLVEFNGIYAVGERIVLWFFPKSNSGGCTIQGRKYAELEGRFLENQTVLFGVSHEHEAAQCRFLDKLGAGRFIPDPKGVLAKMFGVPILLGLNSRDTILIINGKVEKIWRNVNPSTDAKSVLDYIEALPKPESSSGLR